MMRTPALRLVLICAALSAAPWRTVAQEPVAQDQFNNNTPGGVEQPCDRQNEQDGWECTGDPNPPHQGRLSWCHANPKFVWPEGPGDSPVECLPPGQTPPYLQGGGAPEGPFVGRLPPTGQIPRQGPSAYPPGNVTCQQYYKKLTPAQIEEMGRSPYGCNITPDPDAKSSSPYGPDDSLTKAQPPPKPATLKYPWLVGRPGWIEQRRTDISAYRFDDGHIYEFHTKLPEGVLQMSPLPTLLRNGTIIEAVATYKSGNGSLRMPGDFIE
jgi:hypothetical protein